MHQIKSHSYTVNQCCRIEFPPAQTPPPPPPKIGSGLTFRLKMALGWCSPQELSMYYD